MVRFRGRDRVAAACFGGVVLVPAAGGGGGGKGEEGWEWGEGRKGKSAMQTDEKSLTPSLFPTLIRRQGGIVGPLNALSSKEGNHSLEAALTSLERQAGAGGGAGGGDDEFKRVQFQKDL